MIAILLNRPPYDEYVELTDTLAEACFWVARRGTLAACPGDTCSVEIWDARSHELGTTDWERAPRDFVLYDMEEERYLSLSQDEVDDLARQWRESPTSPERRAAFERRWERRRHDLHHGRKPRAWHRPEARHFAHNARTYDCEEAALSRPRANPMWKVDRDGEHWHMRTRISKSWKDQSKRRRQWRPRDGD